MTNYTNLSTAELKRLAASMRTAKFDPTAGRGKRAKKSRKTIR